MKLIVASIRYYESRQNRDDKGNEVGSPRNAPSKTIVVAGADDEGVMASFAAAVPAPQGVEIVICGTDNIARDVEYAHLISEPAEKVSAEEPLPDNDDGTRPEPATPVGKKKKHFGR